MTNEHEFKEPQIISVEKTHDYGEDCRRLTQAIEMYLSRWKDAGGAAGNDQTMSDVESFLQASEQRSQDVDEFDRLYQILKYVQQRAEEQEDSAG
jgi:hypothetical protein